MDVGKGSWEHLLAGFGNPCSPVCATKFEEEVVEPHEDGDAHKGRAGE